jgi:mono/diheme cytochrome c family protein
MKNSFCFVASVLVLVIACGGNKTPEKAPPEDGKLLFNKYCLACHQADGSGVPGMYPPITNTEWVAGDKSRLIGIMLDGLEGEIKVNGQVYKTAMPSHQYLSDEQIAAILTYVRTNFGNKADGISAAEVATARKTRQ